MSKKHTFRNGTEVLARHHGKTVVWVVLETREELLSMSFKTTAEAREASESFTKATMLVLFS